MLSREGERDSCRTDSEVKVELRKAVRLTSKIFQFTAETMDYEEKRLMLKSFSENYRSQLLSAKNIWILHVTNSIMHITNTDLEADAENLWWRDTTEARDQEQDRSHVTVDDWSCAIANVRWRCTGIHVRDAWPREENASRKTCGGLDTVNHSQFAPAGDIFTLYPGHVTRWRQSTTDLSISITSKKLKLIPASVAISRTKLVMESAW